MRYQGAEETKQNHRGVVEVEGTVRLRDNEKLRAQEIDRFRA